MGSPIVEPVITEVQVPPGMLGPDPVTFEVRCFVVVGADGIVLVDTGTPGSSEAIGRTVAAVGAAWTDVTDIVLTHSHFDHTGGLAESAQLASRADVWAGAEDVSEIPIIGGRAIRSPAPGDRLGDLRVFHTPGHTPGHVSLFHEGLSLLIIGDLIGSNDGALSLGPAAFTADPDRCLRSLRQMLDLKPDRIMFSHGNEVSDPTSAIRDILDAS
jgi:glyoxylase-like metal-dependent hydrolase (beta-lactamase superfamily II)